MDRKEYKKQWYRNNIDRIKKLHKKYRDENKEKTKFEIKNWNENHKNYHREYYIKNKEKIKFYHDQHKEKISEQQKQWREKNKEKIKQYRLKYKPNKENSKKYYQTNKKKINEYSKNRKKNNVNFKLAGNLRTRLYLAIKNDWKSGSAVRDLGCSITELKFHLEKQFKPGMSWSNWAKNGWHIDHIKPLSLFDLTDRQQFLEAVNYTNLQPLWAEDNINKSDS